VSIGSWDWGWCQLQFSDVTGAGRALWSRVWLTREIYARLKAIERGRLDELLIGLTSRGQRKALMVRRDLIIAKIDREREEYGDEAVFMGFDPQVIPSGEISERAGRSLLRRTPGRDPELSSCEIEPF
jgi:hypothetical protein